MIEDVASVKIVTDEFNSVNKLSSTKIFNALVITNDRVQYQIIYLALSVIKTMQSQHRGTAHFNEIVSSIIGSLIKILQDEPEDKLYNFNPTVGYLASQILRFIVRPRLEENNEIISKFEKRLIFEAQNIDQDFYAWNEDEQKRKLVDQKDR